MLLSDAKDVRVGTTTARAVYVGATKVWPLSVRPSLVTGTQVTAKSQTGNAVVTIAKPASLAVDDFLLFTVRQQVSNSPTDYTNAHGFVRLGAAFVPADTNHRVVGFYGKFVDTPASEPANYTFTITGGSRFVAQMTVVKNVDRTTPVAGSSVWAATAITNGKRVEAFSLTTGRPMLDLFLAGAEHTANQVSAPNAKPTTGWTAVAETDSGGTIDLSRTSYCFYAKPVDISPTTAESITWPTVPSAPNALGIALRGASVP